MEQPGAISFWCILRIRILDPPASKRIRIRIGLHMDPDPGVLPQCGSVRIQIMKKIFHKKLIWKFKTYFLVVTAYDLMK